MSSGVRPPACLWASTVSMHCVTQREHIRTSGSTTSQTPASGPDAPQNEHSSSKAIQVLWHRTDQDESRGSPWT